MITDLSYFLFFLFRLNYFHIDCHRGVGFKMHLIQSAKENGFSLCVHPEPCQIATVVFLKE